MTRGRPITLAIICTALAVVLSVPFVLREQSAPAGQKGSPLTAAPGGPAPPSKSQPSTAKAQVFAGKVVPLDTPGAKSGGQSDERRMALAGDDGTRYPLVADDVSGMFRLYPQLRDRPVKIIGRLLPGTKDLKVEFVQTSKDGKPYVVDFWCEVCQISHQYPGACVCCGDDLELRERPAP